MPSQLKNMGAPPQKPKKQMPTRRAIMMLGVALSISILIFIFSIFPVTAPLMVGVGTAAYVENATGSAFLGKTAGWLSGTFTGAAEFVSGIGVAVIGLMGEIMADALTFFGWVIFYSWFVISGIPLIGGSSANKRFAIAGGSIIIGMIPFLNIIPGLLIGVTLIVMNIRTEDRKKLARYQQQLKKYKALQKAMLSRHVALQQMAANDNNIGDSDRIPEAA